MVLKKKSKGKFTSTRPVVSRSTKPLITPEPKPASKPEPQLSPRDQLLKKLNLKPSDILSEGVRGDYLIFVTKNGMKIRVPK